MVKKLKGHLVQTDDPNDNVAIRVQNVSKSFVLPHNKQNSLKGTLINLVGRGDRTYETQEVLRDISFEIKKGEFFGIVGRNGSGKSTLLKMLAGIYTPSEGTIIVNGSLTPFIELGVGFNPELTGRENVFLNGALLGFNEKEVSAMYDDIVSFAELERFMDQKLKNYSSGMQVRLAFSIAIRAQSDILLLDEVLAVGDEAFQRKCYAYFAELKRNKKTVILVTHSMDAVQQFCTKAALIDKEHKLAIGTPHEIAKIYRELNVESGVINSNGHPSAVRSSEYFNIEPTFKLNKGKLEFGFRIVPLRYVEGDLVFTFMISNDRSGILYRFTSDEKVKEKINFNTSKVINIMLNNIFPDGDFSVQVGVKKLDRSKNYALFDDIIQFKLSNGVGSEFWRPEEIFTIEEVSDDVI